MAKTKLKVEIDADSAKFNRRMKALGATVTGVGIAIAGIGIAAGIAFVHVAKDVAKMNDELGKNAKKLQISTEELQKLQLLAGFAGVGSKGVEGAFRGLGTKILDLKRGLQSAKDEFAILGMSARDFGDDTFQNFLKLLGALEKVEDKQIKLALANKLMGRQGGSFLAALGAEEGGLAKLMQRVNSNKDMFISPENIARAESMNDQITEFKLGFKKLASTISSETFPAFENLAKVATEFIREFMAHKDFPALLEKISDTAGKLGTFFEKSLNDLDLGSLIKDLIEILDVLREIALVADELGIDEATGPVLRAVAKTGKSIASGEAGMATGVSAFGMDSIIKPILEKIYGRVSELDEKVPNLTK